MPNHCHRGQNSDRTAIGRLFLHKISYIAVAIFLSVQVTLCSAQPALARTTIDVFKEPSSLTTTAPDGPNSLPLKSRLTFLPNPQSLTEKSESESNRKQFNLDIDYIRSELYNPDTKRYDQVYLRGYVDSLAPDQPSDTNKTSETPQKAYVAPTIEVEPGNTVRIKLHNKLPYDGECIKHPDNINKPHCYNGTNLHGHGLWVSPDGNSDNVFLSVNPGSEFEYEYNIPSDHPAGTFWYHPHRHGATALQVSSGMAGALIIRGDRVPKHRKDGTIKPGDIDILLKTTEKTDLQEHTLVLQQIQYACLNKDFILWHDAGYRNFDEKEIKTTGENQEKRWNCEANDVGVINSDKQLGFGSWQKSGRHTSVNGEVLPTFQAKSGTLERWRFIHAGVRESLDVQFRPIKENAPPFDKYEMDVHQYLKTYCPDRDRLPFHVIAEDGLTRPSAWETNSKILQPGYRSDALVVFPKAGDYCLVDKKMPAAGSASLADEPSRLLGIVHVDPGASLAKDFNIHEYVTTQLVAAAQKAIPDDDEVRNSVVADLEDGLKLTAFVPHPDIQDQEVNGHQEMVYYIDINTGKFEVSQHFYPEFEPHEYNPEEKRVLTLGNVEEWQLGSYFVSHPFHIHVNPFQIVKVIDPDGNDVSLPNSENSQYKGLKGVWKDTVWVEGLNNQPLPYDAMQSMPINADQQNIIKNLLHRQVYTVVVRTRYERYIGDFVQHCHILDHEDEGMMENISIELAVDPH